jgi:hypothetical protein
LPEKQDESCLMILFRFWNKILKPITVDKRSLMKLKCYTLLFVLFACIPVVVNAQHSVARQWNELLLESIRNDFARPTVHARNLFHVSAAMYDAWAVYDEEAQTFFLGKTIGNYEFIFDGVSMPGDIQAAREEAISYASYRLLKHRFQNSPGAAELYVMYDNLMDELGYDKEFFSMDYHTGIPACLGNYLANQIINFGFQDGSNEQGDYQNLYYESSNEPLVMTSPEPNIMEDPNRWQPLTLDVFIDQSGNEIPFNTPDFLSPEWGNVVPFSLKLEDATIHQRDGHTYWVYHDPGPPPYIQPDGGGLSEEFMWNFSMVSVWSAHLDPFDNTEWDISPGSLGNIPLEDFPTTIEGLRGFYDYIDGGDIGEGHDINPATGMPYEPNIVKRSDYGRVLAEFWADGPDSETPPGHWFTLLNYVNDHPDLVKKFRGQGEVLDDLEWDIKSYFLLGGTMHDVAISAWGIKGWYDYIRPVSALRAMASRGQSSSPLLPSYDPAGIPLVEGYIELIYIGDPLAGNDDQHVGEIKLKAWRGPDFIDDPENDVAGVGWILANEWWPYQRPSFVTPPFAGYVSGHSTYSRAAAEILTLLTGDNFFPGGMGEFEVVQNEFLVFEDGPTETFTLQWATYQDASDQCSLSRIWGGIHPAADDIPGRLIGYDIGQSSFVFGERYFYRDEDNDGYTANIDCDDNNPDVYPGASELCDGLDNDCNDQIDDAIDFYTYYRDNDNDTYGDGGDWIEICEPVAPEGYVTNDQDCNDSDENINPAAVEVCDGDDNNCNGFDDEGLAEYTYYRDSDEDTFGDAGNWIQTCQAVVPEGYVTNAMDCNDADGNINPNAAEVCDGMDNNCNALEDEDLPLTTFYRDGDGDNYGDAANTVEVCDGAAPEGYVANNEDCDDANSEINPGAEEACDGKDNNCNGIEDDGLTLVTYYRDNDGDTFGDATTVVEDCQLWAPEGYVTNNLDCDDTNANVNPLAFENPDNNIDEDCSGVDLYQDTKIFPNPAGDEVFVHYQYIGELTVQVVALSGKIVREQTVNFENNSASINLEGLIEGVYFISILDDDNNRLVNERILKY